MLIIHSEPFKKPQFGNYYTAFCPENQVECSK